MKKDSLYNLDDLATILSIKTKKLTYLLYIKKPNNMYNTFTIPKRNGEVRIINAPIGELKTIQKKLKNYLYDKQANIYKELKINPNISHAFNKNKNIITNATLHKNKRIIINIDLKDFFDTFHFGRVAGYFEKNRYFNFPKNIAIVFAQLTCYKGKLPQGSPCSPIITNLIFNTVDIKLLKLCKKYKLDYSRYADDLTFSTNDKYFNDKCHIFINELTFLLNENGFMINNNKTRIIYRNSKQTVTGLTVNKFVNVDRNYYKVTRAMLHNLYYNDSFLINNQIGTCKQIEGRLNFIDYISKYNNCINKKNNNKKDNKTIYNLSKREREFQKFLFYKEFIVNDKPLIITEGKTDIRYIKAALLNKKEKYPNLIETNEYGETIFKIKFFKRSKKFKFFFNLAIDGADTMINIYNFFTGYRNFPNYSDLFTNKYKKIANNPTILIFDNELDSKEKPLHKFINHTKLKEVKLKELKTNLSIKLSNSLYLLTNPLTKQNESEIEDLFDEQTLKHKIDGKEFARNVTDLNSQYDKNMFSNYIFNNYSKINFDNFEPMLDKIEEIIQHYQDSLNS